MCSFGWFSAFGFGFCMLGVVALVDTPGFVGASWLCVCKGVILVYIIHLSE